MPDTSTNAPSVIHRFRERYRSDRDLGLSRSLGDYLEEFPGDDLAVARAYVDLQQGVREPSAADRIGSYRIIHELGRGGQGVVYLAEDVRLHRKVALKLMTGMWATSDDMIRRFRREAEVASRLDHPGICAIFDTGCDRDVPYIAMRFVPGDTLAVMIRNGREQLHATLPPEDRSGSGSAQTSSAASSPTVAAPRSATSFTHLATRNELMDVVRVFECVARALHHAHESGVIHRDIKPGNIVVTPDGDPVVLDFGLARDLLAEGASLTQTGACFGTPAFMSPEQFTVGSMIDRRTDVWSLGVSLYEVLTLRRPFSAPTRDAMADAIRRRAPVDPAAFNPSIPRDLRIVLETALQKDRNLRYQTALDLADDLCAVREHRPIAARRPGPLRRLVSWVEREPAKALLTALLCIALLAVAAIGGWAIARMPQIRTARELAHQNALERELEEGFLALADERYLMARRAFGRALIRQPDHLETVAALAIVHVYEGNPREALALLDDHASLVRREPALLWVRQTALWDAGERAAARALGPRLPKPETAFALFLRGELRASQWRRKGPKAWKPALEDFTAAVMMSPRARALYHIARAKAAAHLRDHAVARESVRALRRLWPDSVKARIATGFLLAFFAADEARQVLERVLAEDPQNVAALFRLGNVHLRERRFEDAILCYRRVLAEGAEGRSQSTRNNLGIALRKLGELEESAFVLETLHQDHPRYHDALYNLGITLGMLGQRRDAITAYRKALRLYARDPEALVNLGRQYAALKRTDRARKCYEEAIAINPNLPEAHNNLGNLFRRAGDHVAAERHLRRSVEVEPGYANAWCNLAGTLMQLKKWQECADAYSKSWSLGQRKSICNGLGTALWRLGRVREARNVFVRAVEIEPGRSRSWLNLGLVLRELDDPSAAIQSLRESLARKNAKRGAHRVLVTLLHHQDRCDEAVAELRRWAALAPDDEDRKRRLRVFETRHARGELPCVHRHQ
ncbi:MAG: hypothetical protein CMJ83_05390 [Planctomycetes bacterium]|nr:hypothetical protein [Planctomycetota bacterium]